MNIDGFSKRLKIILEFYNKNAASFAESISVPRSSISHILSGRNKPSLDFVIKIITTYPEVDLYWLLEGKGDFPKQLQHGKKNESSVLKNTARIDSISNKQSPTPTLFETSNNAKDITKNQIEKKKSNTPILIKSERELDRVLMFYKDGTFEEFKKK